MKFKKLLSVIAVLPVLLAPALTSAAEENVKLDSVEIDTADFVSLQSGARTFVNYCLNCHSASLVRYNTLLKIGLTEDQIKDNLMFTAEKIGEPMNVAFQKADAKAMFGTVPPDLSVIARSRGADWLYTYLRSFYRDPNTATGWNNAVFPNVGMPHVLWSLQGERVQKVEPVLRNGEPVMEHGKPLTRVSYETVTPGSMTPVEYDQTVRDLVNFLVWIGEPHQNARKQIGVWVVFALLILIALTYALKKAYWKDVH